LIENIGGKLNPQGSLAFSPLRKLVQLISTNLPQIIINEYRINYQDGEASENNAGGSPNTISSSQT
jgi:hypothetical protein